MAIFTRAQSNPQLPSNLPNPNFQFQPVEPTLDSIFDAYMRSKQDQRSEGLNALQVQAAQGAIAAQGQEAAVRNAAQTAQFGAPLQSYTPQQMSQAALGQSAPAPFSNDMAGKLSRLREGLAKLGGRDPQTLQAQEAARQKESLGMDLTRSQIAENQATAAKSQAEATSESSGTGVKRPATTEFTARGFADKARQANESLEKVMSTGYQPSKMSNLIEGIAPVGFQSDSFQQTDQARRQFVNAVLRRESGAAIPPSELENYTRQYFPVPGDSTAVQAQKAESRKLAISGLEQEGARVPSSLQGGGGRKSGRFVIEEL